MLDLLSIYPVALSLLVVSFSVSGNGNYLSKRRKARLTTKGRAKVTSQPFKWTLIQLRGKHSLWERSSLVSTRGKLTSRPEPEQMKHRVLKEDRTAQQTAKPCAWLLAYHELDLCSKTVLADLAKLAQWHARASFEWDVHPRQPSLPWHSRIRPTLICYLSTVNLIWKLSFVWYIWTSNWHRSISISIKVSCLDSKSQTLLFVSSICSCSCRGMWNKDSHSQASIERNASCLVSSLPLSFQSATSMINVAG